MCPEIHCSKENCCLLSGEDFIINNNPWHHSAFTQFFFNNYATQAHGLLNMCNEQNIVLM